MGKFILDGQEIEFKPGQTIIEAAKEVGVDIPHFCWHPSLSVSGNCRVCLVEIEKMPKLSIACATVAADGMVVHSNSDKALSARNAVMEFLLINHPLDCPICDEAGECKLQDYAYSHSVGESRFVENKNLKDKRVSFGPYVMFDGDRCISCSRCIRFCDEIAGETELTFVKRGDRVTIQTFPGKELDNPYSLNVVDICPVGALTNKDFRFKARVWDMSHTNTICTGCSRGCNTEMWVRSNEVLRLVPRFNDDVNDYWMCDHGRVNTFKFVNAEDRVDGPHLRREGKLTKVDWDEAKEKAASELKIFEHSEVAFVGSAFGTVEDNYMLKKFAKQVAGTKNTDFPSHLRPGTGDKLLITEDKAPNTRGAKLAGIGDGKGNLQAIMQGIKEGKIKALYVIEEDLAALNPEWQQLLAKLDLLIVHATNFNKTTEYAHIVFPAATYAEKNGVWINTDGRAQRIRPAVVTTEMDRTLDGMTLSRLDKFGTKYDRWGNYKRIDARPTWRILAELANSFGHKYKYQDSEDVFIEAASHIEELHGLDYEALGELGVDLNKKAIKV